MLKTQTLYTVHIDLEKENLNVNKVRECLRDGGGFQVDKSTYTNKNCRVIDGVLSLDTSFSVEGVAHQHEEDLTQQLKDACCSVQSLMVDNLLAVDRCAVIFRGLSFEGLHVSAYSREDLMDITPRDLFNLYTAYCQMLYI